MECPTTPLGFRAFLPTGVPLTHRGQLVPSGETDSATLIRLDSLYFIQAHRHMQCLQVSVIHHTRIVCAYGWIGFVDRILSQHQGHGVTVCAVVAACHPRSYTAWQ